MPTPSSQPKPACKSCGKPGFQDASQAWQHERRANPADSGGRRVPPTVTPSSVEPPKDEQPPKREHLLHRRVL